MMMFISSKLMLGAIYSGPKITGALEDHGYSIYMTSDSGYIIVASIIPFREI